ncbi:LysR family transcriptional regulator [Ruegeria arenilitoris]|uniref:LysR family transcriptional regulator n=1 Tax=Ruegeria arenilitoris TaxID=1173585 RepID=UPI00147C28C2|nr:LysR family transcriptional regulator [Ruegeria arenilitoris]
MSRPVSRNVTLKQLRAFVQVAKCGSFSKAADELAISQPALTLSIQQFEEHVEAALLQRTTRSVSLTAQGKEFLHKAEAILSDLDEAILSARTSARKQRNRVRIAALPSVAIRVLPQAIRDYATVNPDVSVQIQDDNGRGVETQVLNGVADFGIANMWSGNPVLTYAPFLRDHVGLICRADHPLARRKDRLTWACLGDQSFVGMADDTGISRLTDGVRSLPVSVSEPDYTVLTIAALVGIVEQGRAVSALPALASPDYLNPSLVYRRLSEPDLYRDLCMITSGKQPLPTAAQEFLTFLQSRSNKMSSMFPNNTVQANADNL